MRVRAWSLTVSVVVGTSLAFIAIGRTRAAEIMTETVSFQSGDESVSAYLARPKANGPFPAIVVIHEWWGLNEWIKQNTRGFAQRGYVALAVDLYRGEVARDPELAHELSRALPIDRAVRDMKAAIAHLRRQPFVNRQRIGSIGWCMGGGYSLQLALNADLSACVICYGRLVTDADLVKRIRSPILGIFGSRDRGISPPSVRAFEKALNARHLPHEIQIYPGAGHAFMNPYNRRGYNPEATEEAWREIYTFLDKHLKSDPHGSRDHLGKADD